MERSAGNRDDVGIEETRAFAGIRKADASLGACGASEPAAAEQALKIENDVEVSITKLAAVTEEAAEIGEAAEIASRKFYHFVKKWRSRHGGQVAQDSRKAVIHEPGDVRIGLRATDQVDGGQSVDNVAKAAGFEDKDFHDERLASP